MLSVVVVHKPSQGLKTPCNVRIRTNIRNVGLAQPWTRTDGGWLSCRLTYQISVYASAHHMHGHGSSIRRALIAQFLAMTSLMSHDQVLIVDELYTMSRVCLSVVALQLNMYDLRAWSTHP
jgi:hypothetical protein